jgi:ADP-ribose pyrophosphatase YjhB (NUDIX family)
MKSELKKFFRQAVSAAIIRDNKIVLIRRENEPYLNQWCFPGGKIEEGETYYDATIREITEELGRDCLFRYGDKISRKAFVENNLYGRVYDYNIYC